MVKYCYCIWKNVATKLAFLYGKILNFRPAPDGVVTHDVSVFRKQPFADVSKNRYLQNSQKNTCLRVSFLIKLQVSTMQLGGTDSSRGAFLCKFVKLLRPPILENSSIYRKSLHIYIYIYIYIYTYIPTLRTLKLTKLIFIHFRKGLLFWFYELSNLWTTNRTAWNSFFNRVWLNSKTFESMPFFWSSSFFFFFF